MRARTHLMGAIGVRAPRHQQASLPGLSLNLCRAVPVGLCGGEWAVRGPGVRGCGVSG